MAKRKASPKRKASKRKPREVVLEELDGFDEYAKLSPGHLAPMIYSEIGEDDHSPLWGLVDALHAIDQLGVTNPRPNKEPLIDLLKSTGKMWDKLLADLISRYDLKRPKRAGRPRRPIYSVSDNGHDLWQARFAVQDLVSKGLSAADAITQVAQKRGIPPQKVADAYYGRARAVREPK
jgi:hypothetical protein